MPEKNTLTHTKIMSFLLFPLLLSSLLFFFLGINVGAYGSNIRIKYIQIHNIKISN